MLHDSRIENLHFLLGAAPVSRDDAFVDGGDAAAAIHRGVAFVVVAVAAFRHTGPRHIPATARLVGTGETGVTGDAGDGAWISAGSEFVDGL